MSQQYKKVFISYSHKDINFVEKLYHKLKNDGVTCFFDKDSIRSGENWVLALEKGLEESDVVILVLSENYFESKWANAERSFMTRNDPSGEKRKIIPLLYKECQYPRFY